MPNIATLWILFGGAFIIATAGKSKELEINGQIRDREVRLIGADGEQKGVVSIQVAMRAAEEAGLDLVKKAATACAALALWGRNPRAIPKHGSIL